MDSVFSNLIRGNRLTTHMGLQLPEGQKPVFGPGYTYVEVPVLELRNASTEEKLEKGLRNQQVLVIPDCTINVRGDNHVLVEPNSALNQFGQVQGMFYIHTSQGEQRPGFYITLHRDMDIQKMGHAVRLYLQV